MLAKRSNRSNPEADADLLAEIAIHGWREDLANRFEQAFGDDIRRLIVLHLWKLGSIQYRFDPARATETLKDRALELFQNTLSDTWIALLEGLVDTYWGSAGTGNAPKVPFLQYLTGVIRNLAVDNAKRLGLLPRESHGSLLRSLCRAKRDDSRRFHIARAKLQLRTNVEQELLSLLSEHFDELYVELHGVLEHFFEVFTPERCTEALQRGGRGALERLVRMYAEGAYRDGIGYVGSIAPWDPTHPRRVLSSRDEEASEDDFLSLLAVCAGGQGC